MGGNALKHLGVERKSLENYNLIKEQLLPILQQYFEIAETIKEPPGKTDFGDMDVLVSKQIKPFDPELHPVIKSRGKVVHGEVISFEYCNFQIDLISVKHECLPLARLWKSADVGQIIGALVKKVGFKFGDEGLFLRHQCKSGELSFFLSYDPDLIFNFLGYRAQDFCKDYESQQELFDLIGSGRVDVRLLKATETNFAMRHKLNTRPAYIAFFSWISSLDGEADLPNIAELQKEALTFFDRQQQFDAFLEDLRIKDEIKVVFNGLLVQQLTGLQGKALGDFMALVRQQYDSKSMIKMSPDELKSVILKAYETYKE